MNTPIETTSPMANKAITALRQAVARVVEEHRKQGRPLAVWRDGKAVFEMPPPADRVREEPTAYYPANDPVPDEESGGRGI